MANLGRFSPFCEAAIAAFTTRTGNLALRGFVEIQNIREPVTTPCPPASQPPRLLGPPRSRRQKELTIHRRPEAAAFYTPFGSCLRHEPDARDYLIWLFARLPTGTHQTVANFTPVAFAKFQACVTSAPCVVRPAACASPPPLAPSA